MKGNYPLIDHINSAYPIHKSCHSLPIYALKATLQDHDDHRVASKLIQTIRLAGYLTVGDILNSSWQEFEKRTKLPDNAFLMFLDFMDRATKQPELIMDPSNKGLTEKEIEKKQRTEDIKNKLRNIGMIK